MPTASRSTTGSSRPTQSIPTLSWACWVRKSSRTKSSSIAACRVWTTACSASEARRALGTQDPNPAICGQLAGELAVGFRLRLSFLEDGSVGLRTEIRCYSHDRVHDRDDDEHDDRAAGVEDGARDERHDRGSDQGDGDRCPGAEGPDPGGVELGRPHPRGGVKQDEHELQHGAEDQDERRGGRDAEPDGNENGDERAVSEDGAALEAVAEGAGQDGA